MKKEKIKEYIRDNIIEGDVSYRGGTLKINVSGLFSDKSMEAVEEAGEELIAGANQNYLGGGIAGRITTGRMFDVDLLTEKDKEICEQFSEAVVEFFYEMNNGGGDEYMQEEVNNLEYNQNLPILGY